MEYVKLKEGDPAWIYMSGHSGNLSQGKVVKVVQLDGWPSEHYIIEVATPVDPVLEIRDGTTVSDDPQKSIGLWRTPWSMILSSDSVKEPK